MSGELNTALALALSADAPLLVENIVRRQGFWVQRSRNLSEYPAHLVDSIMRRTCGVASAGFRVFCV